MRLVPAPDQARWGGGLAGRPGRRAAAAAAAAAGLILVAGCHVPGFSSSAAAGPTASGTVVVAAAPGVADAPLYIGINDGLFSRAGLTVHVVSGSSAQAVAALRTGHANVAFGDYADMFFAQEQKPSPHLLAVADGYDAGPNVMEVLTLPGSGITSPSQLVGKTIGTAPAQVMPIRNKNNGDVQPYNIDTVATWSVLTSDNVDAAKIHWKPMSVNGLVDALKFHQVAAILATEPTIYEAESQLGAVPVLDSCAGATANLPLDGYFTTKSYAGRNAAVVTAFRAALAKAQAQAGQAAPLQSALTKSARLGAQTAAMITVGTYPTTLSAANLQRVVNLMFTFNALPSQPSVSSMVAR